MSVNQAGYKISLIPGYYNSLKNKTKHISGTSFDYAHCTQTTNIKIRFPVSNRKEEEAPNDFYGSQITLQPHYLVLI